jgi:flagellar basal-body rod protein FlgB
MSLIDSPMLRVLSGALDVGAFRQTLLSSNIANVDTPGYRTRDIDFRHTLASALEGGLNAGLGGASALPMAMAAHAVKGLIERPDGNNVSADREGLLLADTQLRFTLSAQLVKAEFHKILSAIREGA